MNQDRFHGVCLQLGGSLREQFGKFTGDPRAMAAGRNDRFVGRILEQRGIAAQEADRQLADFMRRNRNWWNLTGR
jgi:uncharacterized protein YjbJ (UPF0337 family)